MYIDLNVSFAIGSNEPVYVEDTKDIIKSLERLFHTRYGSVPFNRTYGSSLWNLLFENKNLEQYQIIMLLYQEIQSYEPRIKIRPADISIIEKNEHSYDIDVTFMVPSLNNLTGKIAATITE